MPPRTSAFARRGTALTPQPSSDSACSWPSLQCHWIGHRRHATRCVFFAPDQPSMCLCNMRLKLSDSCGRQAGGYVAEGRVNGSLNLSRALGDMEYKQASALGPEAQIVTAVPEVRLSGPCMMHGGTLPVASGLFACHVMDVTNAREPGDLVRQAPWLSGVRHNYWCVT